MSGILVDKDNGVAKQPGGNRERARCEVALRRVGATLLL